MESKTFTLGMPLPVVCARIRVPRTWLGVAMILFDDVTGITALRVPGLVVFVAERVQPHVLRKN